MGDEVAARSHGTEPPDGFAADHGSDECDDVSAALHGETIASHGCRHAGRRVAAGKQG